MAIAYKKIVSKLVIGILGVSFVTGVFYYSEVKKRGNSLTTVLEAMAAAARNQFSTQVQKLEQEPVRVPVHVNSGISQVRIPAAGKIVTADIYSPGGSNTPVVVLLHGAAGINGDRHGRFLHFGGTLMEKGITAVVPHYFDVSRSEWLPALQDVISYVRRISNINPSKSGLVGYSLGGTLALSLAAKDRNLAALAVHSGYLPPGFNQGQTDLFPPTRVLSGDQDKAVETVYALREWLTQNGQSIEWDIEEGAGHETSQENFEAQWQGTIKFLQRQLAIGQQEDREFYDEF